MSHAKFSLLTQSRYSEILDYHNVDAAAQEQGENGGS
jgi:hypothetical protein